MALFVEIVTPDQLYFSGSVEELIAPGYLGEMDILPGHVPYLVVMEPGALMVRAEGKIQHHAVDRGFIQIKGDHVSIMTELIAPIESIDLEKAKQLKERALARLESIQSGSETAYDPDELQELESTIRFAMAQQVTKSRLN